MIALYKMDAHSMPDFFPSLSRAMLIHLVGLVVLRCK